MKENKLFYGWFIVLGGVLITCTMTPLVMALSSKYLIQVTNEMGISRSAFTLANTILQGLGILLSPIVSRNLAKGNMKLIQSVSIIGFALGYASYGLAQNVYHLYLSSLVVGFFYLNAGLIPISMMITNWFEKKRGIAMSITMAGIGLGGFIFSPIVTYLLGAYGWRNTYFIMAAVVLAVGLPTAFFILRKKPEDMGLKPYGADDKSEKKVAGKVKKPSSAAVVVSVKESLGKPFFLLLVLGLFFNGIINGGSLGQFPPAIQEMHGTAIQATIISLYSLMGIFGKLLLGWINDRFGVVISSIYGCVSFALAFVCMLMGEKVTMLYVMAIFFGMGNAIGTVSPPLIVSAIYGTEKYAEAYGFANSFSQIGLTLGSLTVASIFDLSGSYHLAWMILFVLTGVTLVGWATSYLNSRRYCAGDSAVKA